MIGKTNWTDYLHNLRKREVEIAFSLLPNKRLANGLEMGAGDGFQTTLLASRVGHLISSDLNFKRIKESLKLPEVEYQTVDADEIGERFPPDSFDLIFSSNLLEHVRDPLVVLTSTRPMLKDDGYAIHIIPSRHLKIFYILLYYPHIMLLTIDRLLGKLRGKPFFQGANINLENNINLEVKPKVSRWKKFLIPTPHGNFSSHHDEFVAFGRKSWEEKFIKTGYSVTAFAKGPVFSGYGFGFNILRKIMELLGISSEHIFILRKTST